MNKFSALLLILLVSVGLYSDTNNKFRIFTSGCLIGNVGNSTLDGSVSGDFPFAVACGFEREKIIKGRSPKGWGVRLVVPPKMENIEATYEDSKENFGMLFNVSIYRFHKGMLPITKQSAMFIKFKYGTGLSYLAHLGFGSGIELYDCFTLEAEYNVHLTTILLASIYTNYLAVNLGYSFL